MKIPVCRLADLPRGEACRLDSDPPIAVFHTEAGEVYAIDDTCTHQDASLSDGWLEGCEVECPLHASKFDLRSGSADSPPAKRPVRTHQVLVEDGTVYVLPTPAPRAAVHRVDGRT
ncbi:bifunctional 3-phenylpropionate/cinnamic acid dioxygenase ferredoxin subunit [Streptomyces sp. KS 21]|uniref:bifunctional 3-phenylpropionate/cinnamic acid dioxygenase ferredoxin subunit n=1 Tax=Streptomyces sp. KS 21 TaxID=2485150 RepID=UPI001062C7B2|nr:bifunctional 3-phenylpropionate/cinnamic acid dioxygenase ferredoxin subunit [Streptomyces sp. KS 21]TDU80018.1 3-phenylpropionate/trans-cinnamate dioxygenase ferredoxin subunit [Streptomyces sp. KS 21]